MSADSKPLNRLAGNLLLSLTTFVIFIIGWEAAVRGLGISKIVLPPPSAIAVAFWQSLWEGELHWHLAVTLYEVLAGFVLGSIGGDSAMTKPSIRPPMDPTRNPARIS